MEISPQNIRGYRYFCSVLQFTDNQSINQSINQNYFLINNNNKNCNTARERSKGCQRSNTLIKLAAETNDKTHMNTNRRGKRQELNQTIASAVNRRYTVQV